MDNLFCCFVALGCESFRRHFPYSSCVMALRKLGVCAWRMVQCIAAWWATIAIGALVAIGGIGALGMVGHHWWCMAIDYVKSS